jgi:hypothetical protein
MGMYGHMVYLVLLTAALGQLVPLRGEGFPPRRLIKRLFFPVFALFMTYAAPYFVALSVIIGAGFLSGFFCLPGTLVSRALSAAKIFWSLWSWRVPS